MRRLRSWHAVVAVGLIAVVLVVLSLLEGDIPDDLTGFGSLAAGLINRFGAAGSFALLYVEDPACLSPSLVTCT